MSRNASDLQQLPEKCVHLKPKDAKATKTDKDMTTAKAPKALAESFMRGYVVTLQPQLAPILENLGLQHIKLLSCAYNKTQQIKRMEDDDEYFPHSTCEEFKFHVTSEVKKIAEFNMLKKETELAVVEIQKTLRDKLLTITKSGKNLFPS